MSPKDGYRGCDEGGSVASCDWISGLSSRIAGSYLELVGMQEDTPLFFYDKRRKKILYWLHILYMTHSEIAQGPDADLHQCFRVLKL